MQGNEHVPSSPDEAVSEVAAIPARGCLRCRSGGELEPGGAAAYRCTCCNSQNLSRFRRNALILWATGAFMCPRLSVRGQRGREAAQPGNGQERGRCRTEATTRQHAQALARVTVREIQQGYLDFFGEETCSCH